MNESITPQGRLARPLTRAGILVVVAMGLAALVFLAASIFAVTLLSRPLDRDKATAATFVLGAVGGAFMSFTLTIGGALSAQASPRHDRVISRMTTAALVVTAIVLVVITALGLIHGVWPQRVIGVLSLGAAAVCLVEARRVGRGYAVLIAEGEAARAAAIGDSASE